MVHPDADIGIVAGKFGLEEWGHAIPIAGFQTIIKPHRLAIRAGDLASGGMTIVDACHHAQASTYRMLLDTLQNVCLQRVTATIDRGDKILEQGVNPLFEACIKKRTPLQPEPFISAGVERAVLFPLHGCLKGLAP